MIEGGYYDVWIYSNNDDEGTILTSGEEQFEGIQS